MNVFQELSQEQFNELMSELQSMEEDRAKRMPDEAAALANMQDAWLRLKELGWREACYCPKDGSSFMSIEAGSTGIHHTHYMGSWPDGSYWVSSHNDLWPSNPILFRLKKDGE